MISSVKRISQSITRFLALTNTYQSVFAAVVIFVFGAIFIPRFLLVTNQINVMRQASLVATFAFGMSLTMMLSGLDLSIGAVGALASVFAASFIRSGDVAMGIGVALIIGVVVGMANGGAVAYLKIPPFIITFGMQKIANGLALQRTRGEAIYGFPWSFRGLGTGAIVGIPVPVIVGMATLGVLFFLSFKTVFGRGIYAVGDNRSAARFSGIPYRRVITLTYALSGVLAAVAGLIYIARLGSAEAIMGQDWPLQAIAASVLGGVSFAGGRGSVVGTAIGAYSVAMLYNILNLTGVEPAWQTFAVGFVIVFVISIDYVRVRVKNRLFVKGELNTLDREEMQGE